MKKKQKSGATVTKGDILGLVISCTLVLIIIAVRCAVALH